jgi:hypothetical protein
VARKTIVLYVSLPSVTAVEAGDEAGELLVECIEGLG